MKLSIERIDAVTVVIYPEERLDLTNADLFKRLMHELIDEGVIHIVIDLRRLEHINSSGVAAFLSISRAIHQRRGDLRLCEMSAYLWEVFLGFSFDRLFQLHPTRDEAVAACRKAREASLF